MMTGLHHHQQQQQQQQQNKVLPLLYVSGCVGVWVFLGWF
jgi:hypothetical protein